MEPTSVEPSAYVYAANTNRQTSASGLQTNTARSYVYNAAGNAIEQNGAAMRRFAYDGFGRMTGVSGGIAPHVYSYNHLNQRVYKNNESVPSQYRTPTRYFYNSAGFIEYTINQTDAATTVPAGAGRIYVDLNGLLVALVDGNIVSHVETDHLGRPELVLQGSTIKWRAENTAFGRTTISSGVTLDVGFPGQLYDSETSLWYNWDRYYDASVGRYIQSDPIGLAGGLNTFAYVESNPISYVDSNGLQRTTIDNGIRNAIMRGDVGELETLMQIANPQQLSIIQRALLPARTLIRGQTKRSASYASELEDASYAEICGMSKQVGVLGNKAKKMKKLIEQQERLLDKL